MSEYTTWIAFRIIGQALFESGFGKEVIFFIAVAVVGTAGATYRLLRDRKSHGRWGNLGRCLAGGLWSFGGVGLWLGPDGGSIDWPWYLLALAGALGYWSCDLHALGSALFRKLVIGWLQRAGYLEKTNSGHDSDSWSRPSSGVKRVPKNAAKGAGSNSVHDQEQS